MNESDEQEIKQMMKKIKKDKMIGILSKVVKFDLKKNRKIDLKLGN